MADSIGGLGRLALLQGDFPKACALLHEAVTLAEAFNISRCSAIMEPLLGLVTLYMGDAQEARRLLDDSLRICLELNDKTSWHGSALIWPRRLSGKQGSMKPSNGWRRAWPMTPIRVGPIFTRSSVLLLAARLATAQAPIRAPHRSSGWQKRSAARSDMSRLGRCACWPIWLWRRCAWLLTRRASPRRSRQDSSYRSKRRSPRFRHQAPSRARHLYYPNN